MCSLPPNIIKLILTQFKTAVNFVMIDLWQKLLLLLDVLVQGSLIWQDDSQD